MAHQHHAASPVGMETNHAFAREYWYIAAGIVGLVAGIRVVNFYEGKQRLNQCGNRSIQHPTRPSTRLTQAWATATAIVRELSHPQILISRRGLQWASPPPLGRVLTLLVYWAVIVYFMAWNVHRPGEYYYERIAYRNAWVALTQMPMTYLLAMKANPVSFVTGISHERLNWMHRWIARTIFITATVHGFHFWTQWQEADFVEFALRIMPLTKYGFGAWGLLLWNIVVGFVPVRRMAYEAWLVQHIVSAVMMLWLLYKHIPQQARYLLWMSVSFLVFDRAARWALLLWQNVRLRPQRTHCQGGKWIGHHMSARAVGPSTTVVTIKDVHFKWTAGQHVYLWVPRLGPIEAHPYTIACAHQIRGTCICNSIQLIIRAHGGFSKRLHSYASRNSQADLTGFLSGPYGAPPRWEIFETLVLIGASTGASFTVPMLEDVARRDAPSCVRFIEVVLVSRTVEEIEYYVQRAQEAARDIRQKGITVRLHVAITGGCKDVGAALSLRSSEAPQRATGCCCAAKVTVSEPIKEAGSSSIPSSDMPEKLVMTPSLVSDVDEIAPAKATAGGCCCSSKVKEMEKKEEKTAETRAEFVREYTCRPDVESLVREPVEKAWGETAVVVCGGAEVVARTRNVVSALSDESAVHKGTGAQGIYLHVEEYSF